MKSMKRIISYVLVLCMLFTLMPDNVAYAAEEDTSSAGMFSGGSGTEDEPYIIASAEDFIKLATDVNGGTTYQGTYFKVSDEVTETIVLSSDSEGGFVPIGTSSNPFQGTFDGNGKTVKLDLDLAEGKTGFVGLFGYTGVNSVVKNVTTTGIVTAYRYVGGIVGCAGGQIINCHNEANVTSTTTNVAYVGGIVGDTYATSDVINCSNSGSVSSSGTKVGGIVGDMNCSVKNCLNTGGVTGNDSVGGIAGYTWAYDITNCVNNAEVKKTENSSEKVGGIIGELVYDTKITNCYYNNTLNSGLCDAGNVTSKDCSVQADQIVSETVIGKLNTYAMNNKFGAYAYLYWKAEEGVISLTSDKPQITYTISNNSQDYIIVDSSAKNNTTVTVSVNTPSYLKVTEVTVKDKVGEKVTVSPTETGYSFIMPESNVTVSATTDINLTLQGEEYQIGSADDMKILSDAVKNGYDTAGKSFILTAAVSLSSKDGFKPIGDSTNTFKGTFYGNDKTVNLDLDLTDMSNVGLFGCTGGNSVVKNVTTTGTVKASQYVGGIVGNAQGRIINCHNKAAVTATSTGDAYVGGIAGKASVIVVNSSNSGSVNSEGTSVGGILGDMNCDVVNCLNNGDVTGADIIGGIAGNAEEYSITNCVNNAEVKNAPESGNAVGGIIGRLTNGTVITNCYYNGTLNSGLCDAGNVTSKDCAVSWEDIVSDKVVDSLNFYAKWNTASDETVLLYWKAEESVLSLTGNEQVIPYAITNNSKDCITVNSLARNNATVTITGKVPDYLTLTEVTVKDANDNNVDVIKTATGYTFTMPDSNVTISATTDINLILEGEEYQIGSDVDMKILSNAVKNGYDTAGKTFKLISNVSFSKDSGFEPIGDSTNTFKGTFDGNGKTVELNLEADTNNVGLFGYTDSGSLIENVTTTGQVKGNSYVGGIVGNAQGRIINCHNKAAVTATSTGDAYVGGIAGKASVDVVNCSNSGLINSSGTNVGGIIGDMNCDVLNCLNNGDVTGADIIGGIAGNAEGYSIINCVNKAAVTKTNESSGKAVGGIIGRLTNGTVITNCYYNQTSNPNLCDAGYDKTNEKEVTTKKCAVSGDAIVSDKVIDSLNMYALNNQPSGYGLLYWRAQEGVLSLTGEAPEISYIITNNCSGDCVIVDSYARKDTTVTVSMNAESYLKATAITVIDEKGNAVSVNKTETGYSFIMPESNVTISATTEINLTLTDGVYQISSADEMKILSQAVNNGYDTSGKSFKLTSNVSLSTDQGFAPIGTSTNSFNGIFDGDGHTVTLALDCSEAINVGLFSCAGGNSVIKNVTTAGQVKGRMCVGGIVGITANYSKIVNCHNRANVTASTSNVGGIAGYVGGSVVVNCSNSGLVSSGKNNVGGIVGNMNNNLVNCLNTGSVTGKDSIGGIAGYTWGSKITNCVNKAAVTKTENGGERIGGIIGELVNNTGITNSYYNETLNSGLCDAGYDSTNNKAVTSTYCAVSETEIVSAMVLDSLNFYADRNTVSASDKTALLYWKADESVLSLTIEKQVIPYAITNNSKNYVTVDSYARNDATVTVSVKALDYMKVTGVTVKTADDVEIEVSETATGYTFTMPESDVTVSATTEINLTLTDGVYQIGSAEEMKILSNAVNTGYDTSGKSFKLTETVSLSKENGFAPIGNASNSFQGTFDGGNNVVDLNLELTGTQYVGLFGDCGNGSIIKNITTTGTVKGYSYVGGIVGNTSGNIINCHNQAKVTASNSCVGGIVGRSSGAVINCSNSGSVSSDLYSVGGIIGNMDTSKVINCLNTGSITGGQYTGGIAGYAWSGQIKNCVNNGIVKKADGSSYIVGGIAGMLHSSYISVTNCYYNESINEGIYDAGYDHNNTAITSKKYAVSGTDIVSDKVLDVLNLYADRNTVANTALLYWKADGETLSLTSAKPALPYSIKNYSDYLTVAGSAKAGASVEITVGDIPSYMKLVKITVNGDELTADEEGKYVFTMPEKNVVVDAEIEYTFTKLEDGSYAISSAEELNQFTEAVNKGDFSGSVTLTEDITVSTAGGFKPIGTEDNPYRGCFYGDGHILTLDITEGTSYVATTATGLFGVTDNAHIYNLILKGSVDGGDNPNSYTGALIGVTGFDNETWVRNVYSETAVSGSGYVGGIVGKGYNEYACLNNVVHNGTVTQKNTDEDKKAVGAVMGIGEGIGDRAYKNVYYNSEKNSGVVDCGYDGDGTKVESDNESVKAKTTTELFSDEVMDELNSYALDAGNLMFWDISADTQTVKFAETCPVPLYTIMPATGMSYDCITAPEYSRAGKTITVKTNLSESYSAIIKKVNGIKVTDSKGNVIDVSKTVGDTYEFVMPESDVSIQVLFEYDINTDSNGVYQIEEAMDLVLFSYVAAEQPDANAKVTAKKIDFQTLQLSSPVDLVGLIGKNTAYKGEFDGNGAQIIWFGALFGSTDGAVIKDLNISTYAIQTGGVVNNAKNTHIDHCNVELTVIQVGAGIAFDAEDSKITNCSVTASGFDSNRAYAFGGIVFSAKGNTVIANCTLCESDLISDAYGGIVFYAYDETEIYNCANQDLFDSQAPDNAGMIVALADMSGLTLANNFYFYDEDTGFYDVACDNETGDRIYEMTDNNSAVDEEKVGAGYIPAKLNEYIEEHPDLIEGTELKKWSSDYNDEMGKDVICFADASHPELYSIKKSGISVNTLVEGKNTYGVVSGAAITVSGVPSGAEVMVTDENGNEITLTANGDTYVFTMPEGDVTVSVTMDSGIEETTEIDGKTYVLVKTADDFIKAVTSIAAGNSVLNVQIAGDITLTEDDLTKYPEYDNNTPAYNGIFDGAGHTVIFNGLATSMLDVIGENGLVKNLTIDGTINGGDNDASAVTYVNMGIILNCINKAAISGQNAAGIASTNSGIIFNCINKGTINGTASSAAVTHMNQGMVKVVANEGTIVNPSENGNMIAYGQSGEYLRDLSMNSEKKEEEWKFHAGAFNSVLEQLKKAVKSGSYPKKYQLIEEALEWSVSGTGTSIELVFADEDNAPYYICATPDGYKPYQAGSTVEVTFDPSDLADGFVIGGAKVQAVNSDEQFDAVPVSGKENTFSFTMPHKTCKVERSVVAAGLEKDEYGYYLVRSLEDLIKVRNTIEDGDNSINIKLMNNIDSYDGTPIDGGDGYSGIFDGNGHSIRLAMSDDSGDYEYYGLFGTLNSSAVVKNLTIEGTMEANASYCVGAVAGKSYGEVINCVNNATVTNNYDYAGGIVGYVEGVKMNPAKLTNCVNNGTISSGDYDAGGIVSYIENYSVITNCKNNGAVTAYEDAGGIAAQGINVEIINCINTGDISGDDDVCGIVGYGGDNVTIKNCYNGGNVTGGNKVFAIVNYDSYYGDNGTIQNSFYLQTSKVNAGLSSSNLRDGKDSSQAVTEAEVSSGYVAYQLRNGQAEDEEVFWGQTLSGDKADTYPVLGGETVYRNETYAGCVGNPGKVTYSYSNTQKEAVYSEHSDNDSDNRCDLCNRLMKGIGERLAGHSLTLDGSVGVNFYMELSDEVIADNAAYMEFTLPGGRISKVKVSEAETDVISGTTYYKFRCNVNAAEMTDTIKAKLIASIGESQVYEYTVKDYADYLIAHKDEEEFSDAAALVEAMVNYGSYAQIYANYNADKLAVGDETNLKSLDGVEIAPHTYTPNEKETNVKFAGANLSLLSTTTLRMYFTVENVDAGDVTFTYGGKELKKTQSDGYYYVELVGIPASKLDDDFAVTVNDGTNIFDVTYSPMAYCANVVNRANSDIRTDSLKNLIKSLVLYNRAADEYLGNTK